MITETAEQALPRREQFVRLAKIRDFHFLCHRHGTDRLYLALRFGPTAPEAKKDFPHSPPPGATKGQVFCLLPPYAGRSRIASTHLATDKGWDQRRVPQDETLKDRPHRPRVND